MTSIEYVKHRIDLSTNATVYKKTPQGDIEYDTPTLCELLSRTNHIVNFRAQRHLLKSINNT